MWEHRFSCGVDAARLAEDLAAVAVGRWLAEPAGGTPVLVSRDELRAEIRGLRARHEELENGFGFDHLCAD